MNIGTAKRTTNRLLAFLSAGLDRVRLEHPSNARRHHLNCQDVDGLDCETRKVLNLLDYTKNSGSDYAATTFESAYHTIRLGPHEFAGQRNPWQRLAGVPFTFDGATVLDIGCNQGGMLFCLKDRIREGIGVDYDHRMINAAHGVRAFNSANNLHFYVFDLEKEDLDLLMNFIPSQGVDIVILLSMCMWIRNWRAVIRKAREIAPCLLFETNGAHQQQKDQVSFVRQQFVSVDLIRDSSPDDPGQKARRLYICRR